VQETSNPAHMEGAGDKQSTWLVRMLPYASLARALCVCVCNTGANMPFFHAHTVP